jgi:hypothetical protein
MRKFIAAAAGSVVALAGFAGVAHPSATIDLIWDDNDTNEIDDSGPQVLQLNVILTAGPGGSEGGGVSVDFSDMEESIEEGTVLVVDFDTPLNTPSVGAGSALPIELEFPQIRESRVELINSVCFCDLGIGIGLEAGQSHQLGYVTFIISQLFIRTYEIHSDADGPSDGILDGDGDEILPKTAITFNSAILNVPEPGGLASLEAGIAMLALLYRRRRYSLSR